MGEGRSGCSGPLPARPLGGPVQGEGGGQGRPEQHPQGAIEAGRGQGPQDGAGADHAPQGKARGEGPPGPEAGVGLAGGVGPSQEEGMERHEPRQERRSQPGHQVEHLGGEGKDGGSGSTQVRPCPERGCGTRGQDEGGSGGQGAARHAGHAAEAVAAGAAVAQGGAQSHQEARRGQDGGGGRGWVLEGTRQGRRHGGSSSHQAGHQTHRGRIAGVAGPAPSQKRPQRPAGPGRPAHQEHVAPDGGADEGTSQRRLEGKKVAAAERGHWWLWLAEVSVFGGGGWRWFARL